MIRLIAAFMALALALPAAADDDRLPIAISYDYPPFVDRVSKENGLAVAIVREALQRARIPFVFVETPWSRALRDVKTGKAFASFPWSWMEERQTYAAYSAPLFYAEDYPFVRSDAPIMIADIDDLAGRSICRPNSYTLFDYAPVFEAKGVLLETPGSMEACFAMLVRQRVDAVWADRFEGLAAARAGGIAPSAIRRDPFEFVSVGLHVIASRAWPDVKGRLAAFNIALGAMKAEGRVDAIVDRHLAALRRE